MTANRYQLHHLPFGFQGGMNVERQCCNDVAVTKNLGKGLRIASFFNAVCGKGVPDRMERIAGGAHFFHESFVPDVNGVRFRRTRRAVQNEAVVVPLFRTQIIQKETLQRDGSSRLFLHRDLNVGKNLTGVPLLLSMFHNGLEHAYDVCDALARQTLSMASARGQHVLRESVDAGGIDFLHAHVAESGIDVIPDNSYIPRFPASVLSLEDVFAVP